MPRIRTWKTQQSASTARAQYAPLQTRVTGQRRAFLQDYQPAKTGNEVYSEERRRRSYKDNQANILTQAIVSTVGAVAKYQIGKAQAKKNAAEEAYTAETDALLDEAKTNYANQAAQVSAEQKYKPVQDVDEAGNPIFAADQIEQNYIDAVEPLAAEAQGVFSNRKDAGRAQQEFNKFRRSIDLSHKKKLYNEGAAISFKHAQERTKMSALSANSEYQLERVLKTAYDNQIFSDTELYELKMSALERIHTNQFSTTIDRLGAQMPGMSDEQFTAVRDDLVSQLWDDNDALIITEGNRNDMIRKIQALDGARDGQIEQYNDQNYLKVMQQYAESGGNKTVLQAALSDNAGDVFGQENSLKMIKLMMSDTGATSTDKTVYKNLLAAKTLDYQSGAITEQEYVSWAVENQNNIGDISSVFKSVGSERSQQQKLDVKAAKDQLSLHATGMRSDEQDYTGQIAKEQKAERDRLLTDLSAFMAENPNGDARRWAITKIATTPIDPEVQAINGVGNTLVDTDWPKLESETRQIIIAKENELNQLIQSGAMGSQGQAIKTQLKQLKREFVLIRRYANSWRELSKPENSGILQSILDEGGANE